MVYEPPVVVYDACVLYPFHIRNILIQSACDGLVEARWTDEIHAEWIHGLAKQRPGLTVERLMETCDRMKSALPEADVRDYRRLVPALQLPDPDDRHVLAAAIAGGASCIVSWNVKHFPPANLAQYGIVCRRPDEFLLGVHARAPEALIASIANARRNLRRSLPTVEDFIAAVDDQGLRKIAGILRRHGAGLA
ncbi:MAG: PIN domain-containing protein [Parvibaculaceae bacterium]